MKFKQQYENEWVQPRRKNYYMKCCDCGLIHALDFRILKTKDKRCFIQFRARRVKAKEVRDERRMKDLKKRLKQKGKI